MTVPAFAFTEQYSPDAPNYIPENIQNSASLIPGPLAPYTFGTIFGSNLAFEERAIQDADISGVYLPTSLAGVQVWVGGYAANMYYVSPVQVNFLVPVHIRGNTTIRLSRQGVTGPEFKIRLAETAPALFKQGNAAIATRPDWSRIVDDSPAAPGEMVVLYATGLGQTTPPAIHGIIPLKAAQIESRADFKVIFDGTPVEPGLIEYAGIVPGYPGLFQINVRLPFWVAANPQVRIAVADAISPEGVYLPVRIAEPGK